MIHADVQVQSQDENQSRANFKFALQLAFFSENGACTRHQLTNASSVISTAAPFDSRIAFILPSVTGKTV